VHVEEAIAEVRQHRVRDADVVVEQLALCRAGAREDDAVEIADPQLPPAHFEQAGLAA
jgi:hypothetical protein